MIRLATADFQFIPTNSSAKQNDDEDRVKVFRDYHVSGKRQKKYSIHNLRSIITSFSEKYVACLSFSGCCVVFFFDNLTSSLRACTFGGNVESIFSCFIILNARSLLASPAYSSSFLNMPLRVAGSCNQDDIYTHLIHSNIFSRYRDVCMVVYGLCNSLSPSLHLR